MPLAVIEAAASGLPVVATRVSGVSELLVREVTGWLVRPNGFQDIAERVARMMVAPDMRKRMGEAARARAVTRFNLDTSVSATARLLTELAACRQGEMPSAAVVWIATGAVSG